MISIFYRIRINLQNFGRLSPKQEPIQDVHVDHFSKIVSKCCNLKPILCHPLYIPETTETINGGSEYLRILYNPCNSISYWGCAYYENAVTFTVD